MTYNCYVSTRDYYTHTLICSHSNQRKFYEQATVALAAAISAGEGVSGEV